MGYGIYGHSEVFVALFPQMKQTGTKLVHITFIGVLTACSHARLVEEGWKYFECMKSNYGLAPKLEHYVCVLTFLVEQGMYAC